MGKLGNLIFALTVFIFWGVATNAAPNTPGIPVHFLTSQGPKPIKVWSDAELQKLVKSGVGTTGDIPIQKFFESTTDSLDWKDRADIDLLNIYGQKPNELVRLPRFMVVRDYVKLRYFRLSGRVSLEVTKPKDIGVPVKALEINSISKIELTQQKLAYPGVKLKIRTNPAASRGEKLYTHNCLSCHSVPGFAKVEPGALTKSIFDQFSIKHSTYSGLMLSPKDIRGLEAYREALGSEKNEVKSSQ